MEKLMIKNVPIKFGSLRVALVASIGFPLIFASSALAQNPPPPPPPPAGAAPAPAAAPGAAEVERVIVTGSNIPTAEEVGPNPVFMINRDLINKSGAGTTTATAPAAAGNEWRHHSSPEQRNEPGRSSGNRCAGASRFGSWCHANSNRPPPRCAVPWV